MVGSQKMSDGELFTLEGDRISIHRGIIGKCFKEEEDFIKFLKDADRNYSKPDLLSILDFFYKEAADFKLKLIDTRYRSMINNKISMMKMVLEEVSCPENTLKNAAMDLEKLASPVISLK